jgi:deazaflavin-dependent oxidoreductase (nitroreductase family)
MAGSNIQDVASDKVLDLTTIGAKTRLPRTIEIWFVVWEGRFYLFAERGEAANWVKNIRRNPKVTVRIGDWRTDAPARVLERDADRALWETVAAIADRKYGWGDGLPVEITPFSSVAGDPAVRDRPAAG